MENLLGLLLPLLLLAFLLWMIISQRRRQREVMNMQASLVVGDEVLTVGGVIGRVTSADGPVLSLEVSKGVVIRVDRRTVSGRTSDVPALRDGGPGAHRHPHDPEAPDQREQG